MSEQDRIAFEKFMSDKGYAVSYIGDGQYEFQSTQLNWQIWQAATAESKKRIAELEGDNKIYAECNAELKAEYIQLNNTSTSNAMALMTLTLLNTQLQASNNDLREKLETTLTSLEESKDRECRCDYTR